MIKERKHFFLLENTRTDFHRMCR